MLLQTPNTLIRKIKRLHLLGVANGVEGQSVDSAREFRSALESLAEDHIEPLPSDFSRDDIYFSEE